MAIDIEKDRPLLRPTQAARLIPPCKHVIGEGGRLLPVPTHPASIVRWILLGRLVDGRRVRLDAVRLPSGWVTTSKALNEFIAAITPGREGNGEIRVPVRSVEANERASHRLDALGI